MHLGSHVSKARSHVTEASGKEDRKQAVSEVRSQMYDGLYQRLGMKEGENVIYRMAKSHERKMRDIIQVKYIKDATERLLTKDEDIKNK
jgi:hypothetical protein